jgi:DNA repair exonuclease SbcCD ATPase subunit
MRILKLQAENIKRLQAIEIEPHTNFIQITGANAQGKTSILDSIWYALGGKDVIGTQPIRRGEEKGVIRVELDDLIITRKFRRREGDCTSSLFVENKDGLRYTSPQSILDNLVGKLSFDPLAFTKLKAKEQVNLLCDTCDITYDFDGAELRRQKIYDDRTSINRELKRLEIQQTTILIDPALLIKKVSIQELTEQLQDAHKYNSELERLEDKYNNLNERRQEIDKVLEKLYKEKDELHRLVLAILPKLKPKIAIEKFQTKLRAAESININADKAGEKDRLDVQIKAQLVTASDHTSRLADIDNAKLSALKNAKLPFPGLAIDGSAVYYNDIPFEQLSSSEQLKLSLAIAVAANPTLKVIRILDGSLLDKNALSQIENFAILKDYQIWIERVDESGKVGICIENGLIKN